jgi:hypothetical protein
LELRESVGVPSRFLASPFEEEAIIGGQGREKEDKEMEKEEGMLRYFLYVFFLTLEKRVTASLWKD